MLLNSPCNPTGGVIAAEDLRRVVEACARVGAVLVYDETYERFVYDGVEHASAAALAAEFPDTVVVVGSFSKTYAMTGWRLGIPARSAGPRPRRGDRSRATRRPIRRRSPWSARSRRSRGAEADVEAMIAEYAGAARPSWCRGSTSSPGGVCLPPAGAFYAFPRRLGVLPRRPRDSLALTEFLLEEAERRGGPGAAFGADDHVRISFACSRPTLEQALRPHRARPSRMNH